MRLSIPGRIFAAFASLLLVFAGVSGFTAWKIGQLSAQVAGIHQNLLPLPPVLAEIKSELRGLDLVLEPREPTLLRRSVHLARRVHPYLTRLEELFSGASAHLRDAADEPSDSARALAQRWDALNAVRQGATERISAFFDRVEAWTEREPEPDIVDAAAASQKALRRELSELGREVAQAEMELQQLTDRAMEVFAQEERSAVWSIVLLTAVGIALGVALTVAAALTLRPLRTLRAGVERIARGEYDQPVDIAPHTDLGALAADINRMAEAIRNRDLQLARQQRDLLHQERMATVGRLAAQITHELRNPLSSIGLNSELLMDELAEPNDAPARALLSSIIHEVERLREITEAYLSFARIPRPECLPTDLSALASETLEFVRTEMERSS